MQKLTTCGDSEIVFERPKMTKITSTKFKSVVIPIISSLDFIFA